MNGTFIDQETILVSFVVFQEKGKGKQMGPFKVTL